MKKVFLILFLAVIHIGFSQEKSTGSEKFMIGVHYTGNAKIENLLSSSFNGIAGIDARYIFFDKNDAKIYAGLTLDYLQSRDFFLQKDVLVWNPHIGIEIDAFKEKLKPFVNVGFGYIGTEYDFFNNGGFDPADPGFIDTAKINFTGFTINPGFRYHSTNTFYVEVSYKFSSLNSDDVNDDGYLHFVNLGVGLKF